jgi:hypothetical protein
VLADVADEPGYVVWHEPPDGSAGVDADYDLARWVENEAGGLEVHRAGVDECPGEFRDLIRVGSVPDGEGQAVLGDQGGGGGLVIDRQGGDPDPGVC